MELEYLVVMLRRIVQFLVAPPLKTDCFKLNYGAKVKCLDTDDRAEMEM